MKLAKGVALGWAPLSDTWRARVIDARIKDPKEQRKFEPLELPSDTKPSDAFEVAKNLCEKFARRILGAKFRGGPIVATVREAVLEGYVTPLRDAGRTACAEKQRTALNTCVLGTKRRAADPIADISFNKLTRCDVKAWRERLSAKPIKSSTKNHYIKTFRAALYAAVAAGYASNAEEWFSQLTLFDEDRPESPAYLDLTRRRHFLSTCHKIKCGASLANFLRGMYEGGARSVDVSRARVKDFDPISGSITFTTYKTRKQKAKKYTHKLSQSGLEFYKQMARGKHPDAYLLPRPDGGQWMKKDWTRGVLAVRAIANEGIQQNDARYIPAKSSAYSFRHSKITDMLEAGVHIVKVAKTCGTSVWAIMKHYYHVIEKIDGLLDRLKAA